MTTLKQVPTGKYVPKSFTVDTDKEAWEIVDDIMEHLMLANPFAAPEVLAERAEDIAWSVF